MRYDFQQGGFDIKKAVQVCTAQFQNLVLHTGKPNLISARNMKAMTSLNVFVDAYLVKVISSF